MRIKVAAQFEELIEEIQNERLLPLIPSDYLVKIEKIFNEAKEFEEDSSGVYKEYIELNEYAMWHYKEDKPDFVSDGFMFPQWSPEETYKRQLEALEFAYSCTEIYDKMELAVNALNKMLDGNRDTFIRNRYSAFKSEIIYEESTGGESVFVKGESSNKTKSVPPRYVLLELLDYEEAKQKVKELDGQGKNAILLISPYKVLTKDKVWEIQQGLDFEGRVEFAKKCASYGVNLIRKLNGNGGLSEYERLLDKQKDWGEFCYDFWGKDCGHAILSIFFPPYFFIRLIVCLIGVCITNGRIRKGKRYKNAVIEAYNETLRKNFSDIKNSLPYKKIDEAYDFVYSADKLARERMPEMRKLLKENKTACEKAIDFLPPNLDRMLLPYIIEQMKSGAATDYKTALWQAKQAVDQQQANEIMCRVQQAEAERQRKQQEYFQNKQLQLAKQQAESQKRAEEYARQQAEAAKAAADSAQRQAEASAAAAKAAEKQAADTEELLRRTDDPYYVNLWKKSN